jgi:hypothetical protein
MFAPFPINPLSRGLTQGRRLYPSFPTVNLSRGAWAMSVMGLTLVRGSARSGWSEPAIVQV